jgi:hypothetical protein
VKNNWAFGCKFNTPVANPVLPSEKNPVAVYYYLKASIHIKKTVHTDETISMEF